MHNNYILTIKKIMKYTIKKETTSEANTAKEVAKIVGCSLSNVEYHFSRKKKKHAIINEFLIIKNK